MAAFSGTAGAVYLSSVQVAGVSEWSLDMSMSPVETTDFGEEFDSYVPSVRNGSGSFMLNIDTNDSLTAFTRARDAFLTGTNEYTIKLYEEDGGNYFQLNRALITAIGPSLSVKGKGEMSYSYSGEITTYNTTP
jgi:hypothetical protein